jgi:hypothetical protein
MMTRNVLDTVMLSVSHPQKKAPLPWGLAIKNYL